MQTAATLLVFLMLVSIVVAKEPEFQFHDAKVAKSKYEDAMVEATRDYILKIKVIRGQYGDGLGKAAEAAIQRNRFDDARAILEEKKRIGQMVPEDEFVDGMLDRIRGQIWHRLTPNEPPFTARFEANGVIKPITRSSGFVRWSYDDGVLKVFNAKGGFITFRAVGERHFVPPADAKYRSVWVFP